MLFPSSRGIALSPKWTRDILWRRARAVPSLDLRFADNKSLVDATTGQNLVTFTRASSGTYVNSQGVIQKAVTNLLLRSEEFDNASWTKTNSTVTTNATTAPNGTLTAEKLITNSGASNGRANVSITATADTPATLSCYAKQGETSILNLFISDGVTGRAADFNVNTGTVSGTPTAGMTASIQPVGDGWYRCVVTVAGASLTGTTRSLRVVQAVVANDGTSGLFIWGAQFEQSDTVGEYIPTTGTINSAPRFDHNPTTGESLGLLVEESRTNSIRNNTMVGTVAGTPGTLPTNWVSATPGGLTREIVGVGTQNGISYLDVRYYGTPTSTSFFNIQFEANAGVAAAVNQTWTTSVWVALVAGSLNNIVNFGIGFLERDSGGAGLISGVGTAFTPTSEFNRQTYTRTLSNSLTAFYSPNIRMTFSNTTAPVNLTLRIGLPQLEQGAFATSVIPTTTATVTRSADVASITGTNFSSWYRQDEGSVYWEGTRNRTTGFPERFSLNDGTVNNRIFSYFDAAANSSTFTVVTSSVNQGDIFGGGGALNSNLKTGFGFALNNVSAIYSGGVQNTDTTVALPIVNQLVIGNGLGGTIRRLVYWGQRLPNNVLQAITQ